MTRRREIDLEVQSTAGVAEVFALLADGTTWPRWSPLESVELERTGEPPPEGVGAIRVNRRGRTTGRDQIVEVVPGRRFAYVSLSGVPVRDYKARSTSSRPQPGRSSGGARRSCRRCRVPAS